MLSTCDEYDVKCKMIISNVTKYKSIDEYLNFCNLNRVEFDELISSNYLSEITLGCFIGATNTFLRRKIDNEHILDAIFRELRDTDFYNFIDDIDWYKDTKDFDDTDWIFEFVTMHNVIVIDDKIYIEED